MISESKIYLNIIFMNKSYNKIIKSISSLETPEY